MNVKDFFYLNSYDHHYPDSFLSNLIDKKILKRHYTINDAHYYDIQIELDEKFIFENFQTYNINDVTLKHLSEVCVRNAISLQPLADLLSEVRVKSFYYPILRNAKIFLKHDLDNEIKINYYITIVLVPDHLDLN